MTSMVRVAIIILVNKSQLLVDCSDLFAKRMVVSK